MIFTFYSFKGGVGRSMAVAGIANLLARQGLRVLAVDFDLEAPGLERYFFEAEESRRVRQGLGLIDLLMTYKRALTNEAEFQKAEFKHWQNFVTEAIPQAGRGGRVDVVTSGRREPQERLREYALTVRTFDWQDFFDNWKGESFFDWLRRQLDGPFPGYDVVLVDSRTGVTEMGGICAYQLADVAIMLCAANYQNLEGTVAVANDFRSDAVLALRHGRPLELLVIPARLEDNNPGREEFLERFEELFASSGLPKVLADCGLDYRKLALPYNSEFAVGERLVGDEMTSLDGSAASGNVRATQLAATFERLADAMTLLAPPGSPLARLQADASRRLSGIGGSAAPTLVADPTQGSAGYDVFLDASTEDSTLARKLEERLDQSGFRVFYPREVTTDGPELDPSIERALDYSETLLIAFGGNTRSVWREKLIQRARARRGTKVVPLLLAKNEWMESALRSFGLESTSAIDLSEWPAATEFERLIALLQAPKLSKSQQAALTERDPYPGARPFSEDEAGAFFGRDAEIEHVMAALRDRNVVLLVGPSGVGKTSLLRGGVLPRVTGQAEVFGQAGTWQTTYIDLSALEAGGGVASDLNVDAQPRLIILDGVDAFPLDGTEDARRKRIASVKAVIASATPTRKFVLAARGAFSTHEWTAIMPNPGSTNGPDVALEPLDAKNLREAIERPAGKHGHLLEPGLVARLIDDAGAARSAIGKIQLVLPQLWNERRRGWLTNKAYEDVGKLSGVLNAQRARALEELDPALREAARILFRNLMQLNSALQLIPVQRSWSELATIRGIQRPDAVALRDRLVGYGLIDVWREQDQFVCALSRPDAARYIGAEKDVPDPEFFLWRTRFELLVHDWVTRNRADAALLTGDALDEAEVKLRQYAEELTKDEYDFVEASIGARKSWEEAERRREEARFESERVAKEKARRRARIFAISTTLAFLGGIVSAGLLFYAKQQASQAARTSTVALISDQGNSNPTIAVAALHELLAHPQSDRLALAPLARLDDQHVSRSSLPHAGLVLKANFSPDGHMIVSTSNDKVAWLWDDHGRWIAPLQGHVDLVKDARFSPDGQTILTRSDDQTARLWDREGRLLARFEGHTGPLTQAGFSPDGTTIVTSSIDSTARLWDREGKPLTVIKHSGPVAFAAFSPDGKTIVTVETAKPGSESEYDASASVDKTRLWSRDGQWFAVLPGHSAPVSYVGFSSDGKTIVTTSFDRTARLWDSQGTLLAVLGGHTDVVTYAEFSRDGQTIVTASDDGTARLWDRSGKVLARLRHPSRVAHAAFASDGAIVTASDDGIARLWDRQGKSFSVLKGHTGPVKHAAFSPDGLTIVTSSFDRTARLWDRSGKPLLELKGHEGPVGSAAIDSKGERIVTVSDDATARLWDRQGKPISAPMAHGGPVTHAAFARDGQTIATASYDGTARLWDRQGKFLVDLKGHKAPVSSAAFSPDGRVVLTSSADGTARLWDRQGNPVADPMVHGAPVGFVAFSPDGGTIVTASFDNKARLWDRNGKLLHTLEGHEGPVGYPVFSPDGQTIVTPSFDSTARLWDLKGNQLPILKGHAGAISYATFSPDGQTIVTASFDGTARLWNRQGETLAQLRGHTGLLWRADFNPAGDIIVTASDDGTARLWDRQGKVLAELKGHTGPIRYAAFTPDGQWVLTTSTDGRARLWPIDAKAFVERIDAIGVPCLSAEERLLFFPTEVAKDAQRHVQECEQRRTASRPN